MSDLESLQQRMDNMERKLDDALMNRMVRSAEGEPEPVRRRHNALARVFVGVLIVLLGLVWLGKSYGIDWLQQMEIWPVAVIAIGVLIIFGERGR